MCDLRCQGVSREVRLGHHSGGRTKPHGQRPVKRENECAGYRVQRVLYFGGLPPLRGTCFERSRFGTPAHRAPTSFDANSDRAAFDFVPQRPFARALAAVPFFRVGFFFFIVTLGLRFSKWARLMMTRPHSF